MGAATTRVIRQWRQRTQQLKTEVYALYLAYRDPRTPWYARAFAACVVAYAFSPLDLVPDFIPVLGYLDDLVLIPLGIALAIRMVPPSVLEESREKAREVMRQGRPVSRIAAAIIVAVWLTLAALAIMLMARLLS